MAETAELRESPMIDGIGDGFGKARLPICNYGLLDEPLPDTLTGEGLGMELMPSDGSIDGDVFHDVGCWLEVETDGIGKEE